MNVERESKVSFVCASMRLEGFHQGPARGGLGGVGWGGGLHSDHNTYS